MLIEHVTIRAARPSDLSAVAALLASANLPDDGLEEQFGAAYAVAEADGTIIGAEGIECYDDAGLLRSAVVHDAWRGHGIGDRLTRDRLTWARGAGLHELWLLTTTAADYFPRFGFVRAERAAAPPAIRASREFAVCCPSSAIAMRLRLTSD